MTVYDLTKKQIVKLKQNYLVQLDDCGELEEVVGIDKVSWGDLMAADDIVPDDVIFSHYDGVCFTEDDFTN